MFDNTTHILRRFILMLALILTVACDSNDLHFDDYARLSDAQKRWNAANLDTYQINQRIGCFCPPPRQFSLHVEADSILNVNILDPELILWDISEEELKDWVYTVDDVFALISENIDSAFQLDVEYDSTYGYPTSLYLDKDQYIADEELSLEMDNLTF